jgi:hypothetical protein
MTIEIDDYSRQVTKVVDHNPDGTTKTFTPPFDHADYELENARFYMADAIKWLKRDAKRWLKARKRNRSCFGPIQPATELMAKSF